MPTILMNLTVLLCTTAAVAQDDEHDALRLALQDYPHKLLFETNRDGNWELYVMNADGTEPQNLTQTTDVDEVYAKASPDGQWIAFCADTKDDDGRRRRDIYRMRIDGSQRSKVADHARDPFWSPDGGKLGFLPDEYKRFSFATWATKGLRVHDFETGETRDHPNREIEHLYTPTWTPDGRWILATVHGGMGYAHAILAIASQGEAVHNLKIYGCRTDLAPDGRSLTWGNGDYMLGLASLRLDGEQPQTESRGHIVRNRRREGQTYHADWSPDSRFIVYSCGPKARGRWLWGGVTPQCPGAKATGWDLWVADATKTDVRIRLTTDGKSNKEPDWIVPPPEPTTTDKSRAGQGGKGK